MSIDGAIALLLQPPVWAQTWKMSELLESLPGVGPKTRARMTRARIADGKVVGSLSESQKDALVEVLRGRAGASRS